jgi:farnesyl diphosphate synthase
MSHQPFLESVQKRVQELLEAHLPKESTEPFRLHKAMRYSALNPGKRLRPALVYATGEMLSVEQEQLDIPAIAVELIHAYSLIHDDLPCMDNDDLRRGIPTCHIAFDDATAVLAGDALQTLAFKLLAQDSHSASVEARLKMVSELAKASGSLGMGGGQAIDLSMTNQMIDTELNNESDLKTLEFMHHMKTGRLIQVSLHLGYLASDIQDNQILKNLLLYGESLGLAFQIRDDILDVEGDTETLGKPKGSDEEKNKLTFPALMGIDGAKRRAQELIEVALNTLEALPCKSEHLRHFANYVIQRNY